MKAEDYKKQILLNLRELDYGLTDAETSKELSNLIFNIQLYCRKGGEEDLW